MIVRSQTMRQVMDAMIDTCKAWKKHAEIRDDIINPDVPLIVQCGDFGYEVASVGGDPDQDGFVITLKELPVCEWRDGECVDLRKPLE